MAPAGEGAAPGSIEPLEVSAGTGGDATAGGAPDGAEPETGAVPAEAAPTPAPAVTPIGENEAGAMIEVLGPAFDAPDEETRRALLVGH